MSEIVELTQQMVRIPSVNPQDKPITEEPYGEGRLADFIFDWLEQAGLSPQRHEVLPGRENVLAVARGQDDSKTLLLSAHMDTVDVKDMTIEPFSGEVTDGKLYGRGACDDKGPLAVMMMAFRDRARQGNLPYNLALLATCGEEYTMSGAGYLARHPDLLPGKLAGAIMAEPTNLKVVIAHKGVVRLRLTTHGKSSHSSRPHTGKNAIYPMALAITQVEKLADQLSQDEHHPKLGPEVAALTIVQGGQQINVIPDRCEAQVDWRILPGRSAASCREQLEKLLREELDEEIIVEVLNHFDPMESDEQNRLITTLLDATEQAVQIRQTVVFSGATDASKLCGLAIPTPVFGPGDNIKAHTQDEYIEIDQLEKALAVFESFFAGDWGI
jgi:acetylornithine deacetylase